MWKRVTRGLSFRSRNQRQRRRAIWFWGTAATIFLVMQPGYRIGERIIRAARVGVQQPED